MPKCAIISYKVMKYGTLESINIALTSTNGS